MQKRLLFLGLVLVSAAGLLAAPMPWALIALIPAIIAACFGGLFAAPQQRSFGPWQIDRINSDRDTGLPIGVSEHIFIAPPRFTAEACLPFNAVPQERFRSNPSAFLLSAAAVLTADLVQEHLPEQALTALNIRPENFIRMYKRLEHTALGQAQGWIVQDGRHQRAYYVGTGDALVPRCTMVSDGHERLMTSPEREAAQRRPGLHYATAAVANGKPGDIVYLGSLLPQRIETACPDALDAAFRLSNSGMTVLCLGSGEQLLAAGVDLPCAQPGTPMLTVSLADTSSQTDRDFSKPVTAYLRCSAHAASVRLWTRIIPLLCTIIALIAAIVLQLIDAPVLSAPSIAFRLCALALALLPALWLVQNE